MISEYLRNLLKKKHKKILHIAIAYQEGRKAKWKCKYENGAVVRHATISQGKRKLSDEGKLRGMRLTWKGLQYRTRYVIDH